MTVGRFSPMVDMAQPPIGKPAMSEGNVDTELWMPAFFIHLAVGMALVQKGLLTKDEIRFELLKMTKGKDNRDPVIAKALEEAIAAVAKWEVMPRSVP